MTPTELQIAVAQEMGWKHFRGEHENMVHLLFGTIPNLDIEGLVPNFDTSLDACHEFEKDAPYEYWVILHDLATARNLLCLSHRCDSNCFTTMCKATPLQRCEAFLRYKGKWIN